MRRTFLWLVGLCLIAGLVVFSIGCEEIGTKKGAEKKPAESAPVQPAE